MPASTPSNGPDSEQSPTLFYEHDFDSDQIRWHGPSLSLLGWSLEELPFSPGEWSDLIHPDDLLVFRSIVSDNADGAFSTRFRIRHKNGDFIRVHDHGVFYREPDGRVSRRIGTLRNTAAAGAKEITPGASPELIRNMLDSMFVFVAVLSVDGRIIEVNNAPLQAAGMKREDVLGKLFLETQWFENVPYTTAQVLRTFHRVRAGETVREDFVVRFAGELRVVDCTFGPLRNESGEITHMVGSSVDVTDRKHAEETLRHLGRQHEMILNAAGEGICGVDREGRATFVNQAAARMLGYRVDEIIGRHILPHVEQSGSYNGTDPAPLCPIRGKILDGRSHQAQRDVFWRKDGSSFQVEYTSDPIYDGGELVGAVVVFNDISARVEAEEARLESELRFRQVVENIRELFWIADLDQNDIYMSPGFEHIWGFPREKFTAPAELLETIHSGDRARVEAALSAENLKNFDEEFRIVRPDGSIRWIHSRVFPVKNAQGVVYRLAGLAEDVTEARRLNEQLRQSQKLEAVGLLASGVAHDFNNLLTVIQGNASMVLAEVGEESKPATYTRDILQAAEQSAGLTRQLLLFSSRQAMQQKQLQINEVVADVARMLRRVLGEDISLTTEYSPRLPLVYADAGMIEQILLNLAVNARDSMPRGGGLLVISTRPAIVGAQTVQRNPELTTGAYVCISVSDTGEGIPPEILPRIFEPFFTTKEAGKGTGLGLATVYGIVKQHHGWIDVQSRVGEGTTFHVWLPASTAATPEAKPRNIQTSLPRGTETVLVVEDEAALRQVSSHILQRCGYTVLSAENGVAALEVWKQHCNQIDLLLTDMVMPGNISGRELAQHLTADKPELKVIFTSGYSTDAIGESSVLREGSNFLQKPYQAPILARAVRDCLDNRPVTVI